MLRVQRLQGHPCGGSNSPWPLATTYLLSVSVNWTWVCVSGCWPALLLTPIILCEGEEDSRTFGLELP